MLRPASGWQHRGRGETVEEYKLLLYNFGVKVEDKTVLGRMKMQR